MKDRSADNTAAIIDGILKFVAVGGFLTTALLLQNSAQMLEKPVNKLLINLDKRQKERELRRIAYYMKRSGLVKYSSDEYDHGMQLTDKGLNRLKKQAFADLAIPRPASWDKKWRLIFFDIPEIKKQKRNALNYKLKLLGFQMLQKSIWVHPFPCRAEIETLGEFLNIRRYISYVEISEIDSEKELRIRFRSILN